MGRHEGSYLSDSGRDSRRNGKTVHQRVLMICLWRGNGRVPCVGPTNPKPKKANKRFARRCAGARTSTKLKVSLAFVGRKTAAARRSKHACACKIRPVDRARDVGRPAQRAG